MSWENKYGRTNKPRIPKLKAAQHRLHLTAFGAVRGGLLAENVDLCNLVLFKSAAGEPIRWATKDNDQGLFVSYENYSLFTD